MFRPGLITPSNWILITKNFQSFFSIHGQAKQQKIMKWKVRDDDETQNEMKMLWHRSSYHRLLLLSCRLWWVDSWSGCWFRCFSLAFGRYLKLLKWQNSKLFQAHLTILGLTVKFLQRVRSSLRFSGQFINNCFQLVVNLRRFIVEHLLRSKKGLQVRDEEEYPRIVKGWKFIVQFRVE